MELKLEEDDARANKGLQERLPKSVIASKRPVMRNNATSVLIRSEFNL